MQWGRKDRRKPRHQHIRVIRTTERRRQCIDLLSQHPILRATDLAARLGASKRTAYRDIEELRADGYRIPGDPGLGFMLRGRLT